MIRASKDRRQRTSNRGLAGSSKDLKQVSALEDLLTGRVRTSHDSALG